MDLYFGYHNHSCSMIRRGIDDRYLGVWVLKFDDRMVLITPSFREAEFQFHQLKDRLFLLREQELGH